MRSEIQEELFDARGGAGHDLSSGEGNKAPRHLPKLAALPKIPPPLVPVRVVRGSVAVHREALGRKRHVGPRDDSACGVLDYVLQLEGGEFGLAALQLCHQDVLDRGLDTRISEFDLAWLRGILRPQIVG